jgi:hypothetical protein
MPDCPIGRPVVTRVVVASELVAGRPAGRAPIPGMAVEGGGVVRRVAIGVPRNASPLSGDRDGVTRDPEVALQPVARRPARSCARVPQVLRINVDRAGVVRLSGSHPEGEREERNEPRCENALKGKKSGAEDDIPPYTRSRNSATRRARLRTHRPTDRGITRPGESRRPARPARRRRRAGRGCGPRRRGSRHRAGCRRSARPRPVRRCRRPGRPRSCRRSA